MEVSGVQQIGRAFTYTGYHIRGLEEIVLWYLGFTDYGFPYVYTKPQLIGEKPAGDEFVCDLRKTIDDLVAGKVAESSRGGVQFCAVCGERVKRECNTWLHDSRRLAFGEIPWHKVVLKKVTEGS